jgi:hypothetical protein
MFCILFYIWNTTSGIRAPSLAKNCGLIFFQGRDVLWHLKAIEICHYMDKIVVRDSYTQEIQVVLSPHLLATLVTLVGTPSSGSTSNNTCIRIGIDLLKHSIDEPIGHLTVIVPPRTTLEKIFSSTWVVG